MYTIGPINYVYTSLCPQRGGTTLFSFIFSFDFFFFSLFYRMCMSCMSCPVRVASHCIICSAYCMTMYYGGA